MSRIAKWKLEKTKVKVVFRLQFHATHIPQPGWDKLFVSFIDADSGKVIAKTTKANVRNGNCKWLDPIYETTRLLQDANTKQYDANSYKLVVAMGSSRSSLLGEANINLADYADASKPTSLALPLHGCNFGTVLHVTVQLLTSKIGFREFEQQRELREKGLQTMSDQSVQDESAENVSASVEPADDHTDKVNERVGFQSDFTELPSLKGEGELNDDCIDLAFGIVGSSNTSESLYAEKRDISSTHINDSVKSTNSGELGGFSLSQNPLTEKGDQCYPRLRVRGSNEWVHKWSSDYSIDNDLASTFEENSRHRGSLEVAEASVSQLNMEVVSLQSYADKLGAETHTFTQQLDAEIALGEELAREVSILKSECSKLKDDFKQLKHAGNQHFPRMETELFHKELSGTAPKFTNPGPSPSYDGKFEVGTIRKESGILFYDLQMYLQGLLLMENKVRDIQNKACVKYDERDIGFLQPDLEALKNVLDDLKEGMTQVIFLLNAQPEESTELKEIGVMYSQKTAVSGNVLQRCGADCSRFIGSHVPQHLLSGENNIDATAMVKENHSKLLSELEVSKVECESLTKKMDQMECYYEALIQELEESQKQMLDELCNLRSEHSTCLFTISTLKSQMETMHRDKNEQLVRFAEDRQDLESFNKELERRAIISETALKRLRWSYAIAVDQLQKDLEVLSFQVLSMFETNETLIRQTFAEASQLCSQEYMIDASKQTEQELSPKLNSSSVKLNANMKYNVDNVVESKDISLEEIPIHAEKTFKDGKYTLNKVQEHDTFEDILKEGNACINDSKLDTVDLLIRPHRVTHELKNVVVHTDVAATMERDLEEMKRSLQLQAVIQQKAEAELSEVYEQNFHWDVLSNVLHETLNEKNDVIRLMKKKTDELAQQLGHLTDFKQMLMLKLQIALDDAEVLKTSEAKLITICNDLRLRNHNLEGKLLDISDENSLLNEKVTECERLITEYRFYRSEYEACTAEKHDLENLLKQQSLEKIHHQSEFLFVIEELKTLKEEFVKQSSVKNDLEKTVTFLQDKFFDLRFRMVSYNEQINGLKVADKTEQQTLEDSNITIAILHLEELQQKAYEWILQLSQEKKDIEKQRDIAQWSLSSMESQFLSMKQKFESEAQDMVTKLDVANAHVEKLQQDLQNVEHKLKLSSVTEEKFAQKNKELISKLREVEMELQLVTAESRDLAQKTLTFNSVSKELEGTKLEVADCMRENKMLLMSLQAANEESIQLVNELSCIKESLRCAHDELQSERGLRDELKASVVDFTSQLNERNEQMLSFDDHKFGPVHLCQQVSDLESERSQVRHLLFHGEQCQRKVDKDASFLQLQVADLETNSTAMQEYLLAADIEAIFTIEQFKTRMQDLLGQLKSLEHDNGELQLKYLDVVTKLKGHMAREGHYVEENARLVTALQLLRSEFDNIVSQKGELEDYMEKNTALWVELENHKTTEAMVEVDDSQEKHRHELEMERLKIMLVSSEEEIYNLHSSRNELEVTVIVLMSKFNEQRAQVSLLKEYDDELRKLRNQHNELTYKLSEQISKTEQFKNLSIHLKELKDKAAAESYQDREKRETGPSATMQESLRIAFIREQCENKLQELRSQLYVSKKHGEEMLIRLQDALEEAENRKKREASHVKNNEELCLKILALENELQAVVAEKREKVYAYDSMKAELECSMLSLDCCKDENLRLEASLQECNEERKKLAAELNSMKEWLETSISPKIIQDQECHDPGVPHSLSTKPLSEVDSFRLSKFQQASVTEGCFLGKDRVSKISSYDVNKMDGLKYSDETITLSSCGDVEDALQVSNDGAKHSSSPMKLPSSQDDLAVVLHDGLVSQSAVGVPRQVHLEKVDLLQNNTKHIAINNEHFKEQHLNYSSNSMPRLASGLEMMKIPNLTSIFPHDDHHSDPALQGLQRELSQLHMVNERLGSIFPLFREISGTGNALERVLALEIELAEALQAKKSTIQFQSSFLKQHNDEEAIFQSFKDINELIRDTLEVKRMYAVVETELKEMQERYSQLSLQFAEVEGERQQLVMTLKSVRSPRKT